MPIAFRPSKLIIEKFRGIRSLEIDVTPKIPTILIGLNNTCKSTVVNALALALRDGGFHQWSPEKYDFFHPIDHGASPEFSITLQLKPEGSSALAAVQAVGNRPLCTPLTCKAGPKNLGALCIVISSWMTMVSQFSLCLGPG